MNKIQNIGMKVLFHVSVILLTISLPCALLVFLELRLSFMTRPLFEYVLLVSVSLFGLAYKKHQEELKIKMQAGEPPFENYLDVKLAYRYVKINTTPTIKPKLEKCTENAHTGTFAIGRKGNVFVCAGEPVEWRALKFVQDEAN